MTQRNVRVPAGGGPIELDNQFILDDVFSSSQKTAWRDVGGGPEDPVGIMSKKITDALALIMKRVPIGLRLDRIGRDHHETSVRAAAVSATQLIVQRAALKLDLNPEEFEALEPRIRGCQPTLQIADFLVNGAGFCRRLTEPDASGEIMVHQLIASMLDDPSDPLVGDFLSDLHRSSCTQACYRCIQRYGNRNYHGLLDWRLGLGFLRALSVNDYRSGLDGDFSMPELIGSQLQGASLESADLQGSSLREVFVWRADITSAENMKDARIQNTETEAKQPTIGPGPVTAPWTVDSFNKLKQRIKELVPEPRRTAALAQIEPRLNPARPLKGEEEMAARWTELQSSPISDADYEKKLAEIGCDTKGAPYVAAALTQRLRAVADPSPSSSAFPRALVPLLAAEFLKAGCAGAHGLSDDAKGVLYGLSCNDCGSARSSPVQ